MALKNGPLSGVRVIALTQALSGSFGTMLLGDMGAEIIKVEPPTGDLLRFGEKKVSRSLYYTLALNRNAKSLVLDLGSKKGLEAFYSLAKISDVVISNYRAGVTERLGTDFDTLKKINPEIIRTNITGYGETGPYSKFPSFDIVACGHSGILSLSGEEGRPPVIPGGIPLADMMGGICGALSVLAGLVKRNSTGKGVQLDANLLDGLLLLQQTFFQNYNLTGEVPGHQGNRHQMVSPYGIYESKNGYFTIGPGDPDKIVKLIGLEWTLSEEKFKDRKARIAHQKEFDHLVEEKLKQKTYEEWIRILRDENDIACGPIIDYAQAVKDPQIKHNKMIWDMELNGKKYKTIGSLFKIPESVEGTPEPAPDLGANTEEILKKLLDYSDDQIKEILLGNDQALPRLQERMKQIS
ncbi:MAG: CoA transferase [Deltaproteobacteria bacterium]|nr:CoA transferase [Deltaproteobacteria bacterium]